MPCSRIKLTQVFDAENALEPKVAYEFPWDPTEDPQKFHIVESSHRVDCEDGTLTDECYKHRWHPPESSAAVAPVEEHDTPEPDIVVPKGEGGGSADTELPPEESGETLPPPHPPEKMPPTESESGTAPRPKDDMGESPLEKSDSDGVEQERGEGEFDQPVGTPDSIKGSLPEPKNNAPPEARKGKGPEARPQSGYATISPSPSPTIVFDVFVAHLTVAGLACLRPEASLPPPPQTASPTPAPKGRESGEFPSLGPVLDHALR